MRRLTGNVGCRESTSGGSCCDSEVKMQSIDLTGQNVKQTVKHIALLYFAQSMHIYKH